MVLKRLRPDAKRRRSTERESPRGEADRSASIARQKLAREAGLPDSRISKKQDHAELTRRRQLALALELCQLGRPADQPCFRRHRSIMTLGAWAIRSRAAGVTGYDERASRERLEKLPTVHGRVASA